MHPEQHPVVIIGAGISGLSLAYYLKKLGIDSMVLEQGAQPGGLIGSSKEAGYLSEAGPNGLFISKDETIFRLIQDLGLAAELQPANPASKQRYIYWQDKLQAVPTNPLALLRTPLLSPKAKLRLLAEPWIKPNTDDESLATFVRRRLGEEVLQNFIDPLATGIYAGDVEKLSVLSAFPKIKQLELAHGSLVKGFISKIGQRQSAPQLYGLQNGMRSLIAQLVKRLNPRCLKLNSQVTKIAAEKTGFNLEYFESTGRKAVSCQRLVIATGAPAAVKLVAGFEPRLSTLLQSIHLQPIVSINLGYGRIQLQRPLDGYGFLVPSRANLHLLGAIWNSSLFTGRAPQGAVALTAMLAGARHPEHILKSDHELMGLLRMELSQTMGIAGAPLLVKIHRYPNAIPQYEVGHAKRMEKLLNLASKYPLHFTGNYIDGIGVAHCVERSADIAAALHPLLRRRNWNKSLSLAPAPPA